MKYCNNCGVQLEDTLAFCTMCGAKQPPPVQPASKEQRCLHPTQPVAEPPAEKKKRKGLLIALVCGGGALVLAAVAVVIFLKWYQDPRQQLDRALEEKDWDQVLTLVDQNSDLGEDTRVIEVLEDRVAELTEQFNSGKLEYDVYIQELNDLAEMNPEALAPMIEQAQADALVQKEYGDCLTQAQSYMAQENYALAIESYQKISEGPLYQQAQEGCREAENALRREILDQAEALADEGSYAQAWQTLEQGLQLLPQDADLLQQQQIYQQAGQEQLRDNVLREAENYVNIEEYPAAFKVLRDYLKETGEDSAVSTALSDYENQYVELTIEKADAHAGAYRFEEAFAVLEAAQNQLPNDSRLTTAVQEIEKLQPVSLGQLQPMDSYRWNPNEARLEDCLGNEFYDSVNAYVPDHEGYALFQINGAYTRVTGQLSSLWVQKRESFFLIYGDDELLFYSRGITPTTKPFTFDVNIPEGTKQVKFYVVSDAFHNSSILLTDVYLWP